MAYIQGFTTVEKAKAVERSAKVRRNFCSFLELGLDELSRIEHVAGETRVTPLGLRAGRLFCLGLGDAYATTPKTFYLLWSGPDRLKCPQRQT